MATRINHRQLKAFRAVMITGVVTRARLAEDFVARVKTLLAENPLIG